MSDGDVYNNILIYLLLGGAQSFYGGGFLYRLNLFCVDIIVTINAGQIWL